MLRLAALALLVALGGPAVAQDGAAEGRYQLVPVPEGALRVDTETGEVSLCSGAGPAPSCRAVPEEEGTASPQADASDRIARLEARIAALEARAAPGMNALTGDEALDRVAALADKMMRRFFGLVEDMKRDLEEGEL